MVCVYAAVYLHSYTVYRSVTVFIVYTMYISVLYSTVTEPRSICLDILKDQWSPALTISKVRSANTRLAK